MWNGKKKAITFSFDDGCTQDIRLIELLNRYGFKATFNINSGKLGGNGTLERCGKIIPFDKVKPDEVKDVYKDHEVAVHTRTHPHLPPLNEERIIDEVEGDRRELSRLCGYEVVGMAYPGGGVNNDDRVAKIVKEKTGVKYARTIASTCAFSQQENLHRFNPSIYWIDPRHRTEVVENFFALETDEPQLLYIWGHSFELDAGYHEFYWKQFEAWCERLAGKSEIFYGTNRQVLLGMD